MSESQRLGRLDYLRSAISGKGPQLMEQYGKNSLKVLLFPGHFIRQEIILRQRMVLENRLLDPVDRVHEADTMLWVGGLPYGRGGERDSSAWSVSWDNWRGALSLFDDLASQRSWYKSEVLLEIEETVPMMDASVQDDGTSKVVTKMQPIVRTVRQDTFDALRVVDAHLLASPTKQEGWEPMKLLKRTEQKPDPEIEELKAMTGYDPLTAERGIQNLSQDMLKWASMTLNRSFRDKDTPSQTGDIFLTTTQQNQQPRFSIDPTSTIGKPPAKGRTGVHQA